MTLFAKSPSPPLAERQRPANLDEFLGQPKIWYPGSTLRKLVEGRSLRSAIFWGPPGCGKTTIAELAAKYASCSVARLSAISAGVKDLRATIDRSEQELAAGHEPVLLFLDEVHRLNKNQQDILLPGLEKGVIRFIGATTENPSFAVNNAVISRCLIFRFDNLEPPEIDYMLRRSLAKDPRLVNVRCADSIIEHIANACGGDARRAYNMLEALAEVADSDEISEKHLADLEENLTSRYDRDGDGHYDTASALIKCIRAGQADAALHYLARMIDGGEKPEFIARRLIISASEDIGNANPHMLTFATSALAAVQAIGMPEGRIVLGQIVTLLASSPKSNRAYLAVDRALADVRKHRNLAIPMSLRNAPTQMMKDHGYGKGYVYAHDDPEGASKMAYLPPELENARYYEPGENGYEKNLQKR